MNDKVNEAQAYWDSYDKADKEESGGGGAGIISYATISTGYRVFAGGVAQSDAFFAADPANENDKATAKKAAERLSKEHDNCGFKWGLAIITPTEQSFVRGEQATWNTTAMVRFWESWKPAASQVMLPSIKEHNCFPLPWKGWVRLGFKPDPYAVEKDIKDAEGRYEQVPYVVEVFKNPRLAKKAIAEMPKGDAKADVPEGYTAADWDELRDIIVEALESQEVGEVAEDYQVDESYIQAIADSVVPV